MASAVHNRSEIFDTIVKKLRRNPFFMNAFLRSFADYGFEPVEQNVAVRNSERKNRQMGTALGKGNGSFDARPLETELHFVVQRDLFCALESTVKTYEMSCEYSILPTNIN
ncbi:hypothetical protein D918_10136 [Trichuris suis]|nr:hypothetical protein D918_10136 [Trichuris suis]